MHAFSVFYKVQKESCISSWVFWKPEGCWKCHTGLIADIKLILRKIPKSKAIWCLYWRRLLRLKNAIEPQKEHTFWVTKKFPMLFRLSASAFLLPENSAHMLPPPKNHSSPLSLVLKVTCPCSFSQHFSVPLALGSW